jgi:HEAT repeat protein
MGVRAAAATALGEMQRENFTAVRRLVELAARDEPSVRQAAIAALGSRGGEGEATALLALAGRADVPEPARLELSYALARLTDERAAEGLEKLAADRSEVVAAAAAARLVELARRGQRVRLARLEKSRHPLVRLESGRGRAGGGNKAALGLLRRLVQDPVVGGMAWQALREVGAEPGSEWLERHCRDERPAVRAMVLRGFAAVDPERFLELAGTALAAENPALRLAAVQSLGRSGAGPGVDAARVVRLLSRVFAREVEPSDAVRVAAVQALEELAVPAVFDVLREELRGSSDAVAAAAAKALVHLAVCRIGVGLPVLLDAAGEMCRGMLARGQPAGDMLALALVQLRPLMPVERGRRMMGEVRAYLCARLAADPTAAQARDGSLCTLLQAMALAGGEV